MTHHLPYLSRLLLGRELKKHRASIGWTLAQAHRETGISDTKLSKLESGKNRAIRQSDIFLLGHKYQVDAQQQDYLLRLTESCDRAGWYEEFDVAGPVVVLIEQESVASKILIVELSLVDGLFQTGEYLDEVAKALRAHPQGTSVKLERQESLWSRKQPPEIVYITDESVLRRRAGSADVMDKQLLHLQEKAQLPNVQVLVVPLSAGPFLGIQNSFRILYFEGGEFSTTVHIESSDGSRFEERDKIVWRYENIQERLLEIAVPIEDFLNEHHKLAQVEP